MAQLGVQAGGPAGQGPAFGARVPHLTGARVRVHTYICMYVLVLLRLRCYFGLIIIRRRTADFADLPAALRGQPGWSYAVRLLSCRVDANLLHNGGLRGEKEAGALR